MAFQCHRIFAASISAVELQDVKGAEEYGVVILRSATFFETTAARPHRNTKLPLYQAGPYYLASVWAWLASPRDLAPGSADLAAFYE